MHHALVFEAYLSPSAPIDSPRVAAELGRSPRPPLLCCLSSSSRCVLKSMLDGRLKLSNTTQQRAHTSRCYSKQRCDPQLIVDAATPQPSGTRSSNPPRYACKTQTNARLLSRRNPKLPFFFSSANHCNKSPRQRTVHEGSLGEGRLQAAHKPCLPAFPSLGGSA